MTSAETARRIFRDVLVPLAEANPGARLDFHASFTEGSYFRLARRPRIGAEDMRAFVEKDELSMLADLWSGELGELKLLLPHLEALAEQIAAETDPEGDSAEAPSTLVYQMW